MKRFVRTSLLAAAAVSLAACSSGPKLGGGKEGAAKALYQASNSTSQSAQGQVLKRAMASQEFNLDGSVKVKCTHGGSATMSVDTDSITAGDTSVSLAFDIEYDDCNEDGKNELNGDMKMGFLISTDGSSSFEFGLTMKGEIDISGEVDDYIDANVTQYVGFNGLSNNITVKLKGTIETRSGEYTYDNESFTFADLLLSVDGEG